MAIGVGVVLAIGVPVAWSQFGSSDVPADVGAGMAVSLAEQTPAGTTDRAPVASSAAAPSSSASRTPATAPRTSGPASSTRAPDPTSSRPGTSRSTASRSTAPRGTAPGSTAPAPAVTSSIPIVDGDPAAVAGAKTPEPDRLTIDALGVDAPVVPVGVDDKGDLAIPEDVNTVGWYRYGPSPGAAVGSVVIAGHVDSATQGVGELRALWNATPGMVVQVRQDGGPTVRYRVVSREIFVKGNVPLASLFSTGGAARLTLITCGGPFDEETRSYLDNVVVTAVPA